MTDAQIKEIARSVYGTCTTDQELSFARAIRREAMEEAALCADKHADAFDGDPLPGAIPTVRERNACRRVAAAIRALSQKESGE
jgi:8-oxo-dGTP pyrophosphatase MutT (NUDIX family)